MISYFRDFDRRPVCTDGMPRRRIERIASYLLDSPVGNYAFLRFADRVEIWKRDIDFLYRKHTEVEDHDDLLRKEIEKRCYR